MILMSITMFTLGTLALMDTIYNYDSIFRVVFSFVLIGFSVLLFAKAKSLPFFDKPATPSTTVDNLSKQMDMSPASHLPKGKKAETVNR